MKIGVTIDCPDPDQLAAFWEQFLGYERRPGGAGRTSRSTGPMAPMGRRTSPSRGFPR